MYIQQFGSQYITIEQIQKECNTWTLKGHELIIKVRNKQLAFK